MPPAVRGIAIAHCLGDEEPMSGSSGEGAVVCSSGRRLSGQE